MYVKLCNKHSNRESTFILEESIMVTIEEVKKYFPEVSAPNEDVVGYCYVTYCLDTGQIYIGKKNSTKFVDTYYGSGITVKCWKIMMKYKLDHWSISWSNDKQVLLTQESDWVSLAKQVFNDDCVNVRPGGAPAMLGRKHSPETIEKIRESAKRIKHKPLSQETKDRISAANIGKHGMSEERRKAVGDFHRGRKRSAETCAKIGASKRGENNPFYGTHHSEETKTKISEAQKGRIFTPEHREKIRQGVLRYFNSKKQEAPNQNPQ